MNIALLSDLDYAHVTSVAIKSVLRTNSPARIDVIDAGMTQSQCEHLQSLSPLVNIVAMPDFVRLWLGHFSHGTKRVPISTFLKAQLHWLLPDLERVIYIDGDVIALQDLSALFAEPLGDAYMVGATCNEAIRTIGRRRLKLRNPYFNAGVLLCPLEKWRRMQVDQAFLRCYIDNQERIKYADQDVFNILFDGRVKWIDKRWNVSHKEVLSKFHSGGPSLGETAILHFNGDRKPWDADYREEPYLNDEYYRASQSLIAPLQPAQEIPEKTLYVSAANPFISGPPLPAHLQTASQGEIGLCTLVEEQYVIGLAAFLKSFRKWNPHISYPFLVYACMPLSDQACEVLVREYPWVEFRLIESWWYTRCSFTRYRTWGMNPAFRYELFRNQDYDQLIYFDSDMLVMDKLDPLFAFRGELGACVMKPGEGMEMKQLGGFNAGLLSIGRSIRTPEIWADIMDIAQSGAWSGNQTVLNLSLQRFHQPLPDEYNVRTSQMTMEMLHTAKIIHYVGWQKPWEAVPFDPHQLRHAGPPMCQRLLDIWRAYLPEGAETLISNGRYNS